MLGLNVNGAESPTPACGAKASSVFNPRMGASGERPWQVLRKRNQGPIPGGTKIKAPVLLPFTSCLFGIASPKFSLFISARQLRDPALWTSQVGQHFR